MLNYTKTIFFFIALLSLIFTQAVMAAAEPIGQAIWIKGQVQATQPNQAARLLQRRSPLYEHDIITTSNDSSGQIAFTDSSTISLSQDSQLVLDQYHHNSSGPASQEKSVMSIVKGGFRTITGAIPKANLEGYSINTPVATIGVRGTEYNGYFSLKEGLSLQIDKGKIVVKNDGGTIEMEPCPKSEASKQCTPYALVTSLNAQPVPMSALPPALRTQAAPTLQHVSAGVINSISTTPPPGGGGPTAPAKGFCIGFLNDLLQGTAVGRYIC